MKSTGSYRQYNDEDLVCLMADHDEGAFAEIYERYAGVLYVHARQKLSDRDMANDVVHDMFASLWENRATLTINTNLSTYLYTAIRYRVISVQVREKRFAQFEVFAKDTVEKMAANTDHLVREKELRELIESEVSQLPKKMREIFHMSRQLHLSHREIAEQLDLSPATVKKQVNNALKVLRVKLETLLAIIFFISL